jgi:hypothetical protein
MALLSHILTVAIFYGASLAHMPVIWWQVGLQDVQAGTPARMREMYF